jgi:hypothetical protein
MLMKAIGVAIEHPPNQYLVPVSKSSSLSSERILLSSAVFYCSKLAYLGLHFKFYI